MAKQKKVQTSYDSGDNNTARKAASTKLNDGDWGQGAGDVSAEDKQKDTLDRVMGDFTVARDYVKDNYQGNWEDYWQCYSGMRTKRGYQGISDDFVPETFTIIESVKANIAGGKPKFNFVPMNEEQKQDTEILNNLIDYYWDCNRMTQKTQNWVQDMLVYGNGVMMVTWEDDKPRVVNIPLFDFFVDPTATHMNNPSEPGYPKYAGYRFLANVDDLKGAKLVDPETGEMTEKYKGLDDIEEMGKEWDELEKDVKEKYIGSTLGKDANKKQIECIVYYSLKKKHVIANRNKIIYEGDNPYQRPARTEKTTAVVNGAEVPVTREIPEIKSFLPFAILRNYVDSTMFYAKGDVAIIIDRQETLNDISNQKQDNITYVLNNMWQIDPAFAHLADQIESLPGAVYPIPKGALAPIEKQMVSQDADMEMQRIKDEMRRATAADEVVQGVSQDKGRVTATEVQAQLNQASQRFSVKPNTLESEGYSQLGRILFKMVQIFVTQEMAVRVVGPEGVSWKDFDPNEFNGDYEPKVELETTTKAVKVEEGQKYQQLSQLIMNNPLVNQQEFLRIYFDKAFGLDEETIKRLLQPAMPAGMGAGVGAGATMGDPMAAMGGMLPPGMGANMPAPPSPVPSAPLPTA